MAYGYAEADPGTGGPLFAIDLIGSWQYPLSKVGYGAEGDWTAVTPTTPLPTMNYTGDNLLRGILNVQRSPMGYDSALKRYRQTAIIESGTITTVTTVTTVTTCASVTNLASIGGDQGQLLTRGANQTAWALNMRARIT